MTQRNGLKSVLQKTTTVMQNLLTQLSGYENLTAREKNVLHYVAKGYTNKELADHFNLSAKSMERELTNIYASLNFNEKKERRTALFVRLLELCGAV
jgi:DNA-binding NarL/FixJ family response regulator